MPRLQPPPQLLQRRRVQRPGKAAHPIGEFHEIVPECIQHLVPHGGFPCPPGGSDAEQHRGQGLRGFLVQFPDDPYPLCFLCTKGPLCRMLQDPEGGKGNPPHASVDGNRNGGGHGRHRKCHRNRRHSTLQPRHLQRQHRTSRGGQKYRYHCR